MAGTAVAVLGVVVAVVAVYPDVRGKDSSLELVKISVEGRQEIPATVEVGDQEFSERAVEASLLDIRVRNRGELESAVTDIGVEIERTVPLELCVPAGGWQGTSARYDLTIPENAEKGDRYEAAASQAIPAGQTDRFSLSVGSDVKAAALQLKVFLKEGEDRVDLTSIGILSPPTSDEMFRILAGSSPYERPDPDCVSDLRDDLQEIEDADDAVVSAGLKQLVDDLEVIDQDGIGSIPKITPDSGPA